MTKQNLEVSTTLTSSSRRGFIKTATGTMLLAAAAPRTFLRAADESEKHPAASARKPFPYRVVYSNDTTHILACTSPYHKQGEGFRPEMLESSVDEVSGLVDAHFLQPGVAWVPWWKSAVYPAREHYRWFEERYGVPPDTWGEYMLAGGDLVELFVQRCRFRKQAPFVSLRLNDVHYKEYVNAPKGTPISIYASQGLSRFYEQNQKWRIGDNMDDWMLRGLNWAVPEVRAHKFAFLEEICANYDIEGIELDFMRYFSYFQLNRTTPRERCAIMTAFVADARTMLDRTTRAGRGRRWLAARVPALTVTHDILGIDLPAMVEAGLDVATLSTNYFATQQSDLPAIRKSIPSATVLNEVTHVVSVGKPVKLPGAREGDFYDTRRDRRATPQLLATAAHLAYANGADGVSVFNFPYYREYGVPHQGPFSEPPLHMLGLLGERDRLALIARQHYILTPGWRGPGFKQPLPRAFTAGEPETFVLNFSPPVTGWRNVGRLRIQGESSLGISSWSIRLNGYALRSTPDVSEPYANIYTQQLGSPGELRAWFVRPDALVAGVNTLEIMLEKGSAPRITCIDLWIS
ncbi:MAG: hypothetical protein LBI02_02940 [Opitutaceae bacterium]|jgi:hypothetical protein|nr:hypothetical protein [Opitutaceae bacterium]